MSVDYSQEAIVYLNVLSILMPLVIQGKSWLMVSIFTKIPLAIQEFHTISFVVIVKNSTLLPNSQTSKKGPIQS